MMMFNMQGQGCGHEGLGLSDLCIKIKTGKVFGLSDFLCEMVNLAGNFSLRFAKGDNRKMPGGSGAGGNSSSNFPRCEENAGWERGRLFAVNENLGFL